MIEYFFPGNILLAREVEYISDNSIKFIFYDFPYFADKVEIRLIDYKMQPEVRLDKIVSAKEYFLQDSYFTKKQLRYFRNSIYAMHGRKFNDYELKLYFSNFNLYKINENFNKNDLSSNEQNLIHRIIELENSF